MREYPHKDFMWFNKESLHLQRKSLELFLIYFCPSITRERKDIYIGYKTKRERGENTMMIGPNLQELDSNVYWVGLLGPLKI
jgi:hypothetical protein